ncbi:MAG: hypothetical protein GY748_10535 [Planctomycetaceae bacterium]|nr:hypothetical protein [Planctomycetaceae bacterium]MCP4478254.1 hypothetical protein [Planctomycetaceae bacterium]
MKLTPEIERGTHYGTQLGEETELAALRLKRSARRCRSKVCCRELIPKCQFIREWTWNYAGNERI